MENSTKALIIAGSVLIAIVLIAIGINILGSTADVTEQVNSVSDTMATSVFNSQFTPYLGDSVSGTQARSLVQKIMANNSSSSYKIHVWSTDVSGNNHTEPQDLYDWLKKSSTYKIFVNTGCSQGARNGYYSNGFLCCIKFDKIS